MDGKDKKNKSLENFNNVSVISRCVDTTTQCSSWLLYKYWSQSLPKAPIKQNWEVTFDSERKKELRVRDEECARGIP